MDVMYRPIYVTRLFSKWRHMSQLSKFPGQVWHRDTLSQLRLHFFAAIK